MLTKKQKPILDFIESFIEENDYSPSISEIGKRLKLANSTVHEHIENLKEKGYLNKSNSYQRAIKISKKENLVRIPLLGTIAAGQPLTLFDTQKETIAIPKNKLPRSAEVYALRVVGNSMIDENINDGDIVLVKHQATAENGQKVVALIDNQEATLKKFYKEHGYIRLQPANKSMEPIIIRKDRDFTIQGVVIDVISEERNTVIELPKYKEIETQKELPINQIILGNAVDVMKEFPSNSIDLVITSPPYDNLRNYKGYHFDFEGIAKSLFRVVREGGVVVWVVGDETIKGNETGSSFRQALYFKECGFKLFDTMIYSKPPRGAVGNNKTYWQSFEYMFILSKGKPKTVNLIRDRKNKESRNGDNGTKRLQDGSLLNLKRGGYGEFGRRKNIWEYNIGKGHSTSDNIAFEHPAIFPEKLAKDHIVTWSNVGDVVYDPMMGSGTVAKMCILEKRNYIGSEISEEYCNIAQKRIKSM